jgi:hypothetical protein
LALLLYIKRIFWLEGATSSASVDWYIFSVALYQKHFFLPSFSFFFFEVCCSITKASVPGLARRQNISGYLIISLIMIEYKLSN